MDSILSGFVAGALFFFVAALGGLLWVLITQLVPQISKTLNAYERLAGTLEEELTPTLREVNKVVGGITELKSIAVKNVTDVSTRVEDVTGSVTKVADTAKKHSSIWGAGLFAGARAYFEGHQQSKNAGIKETQPGNKQDGKQVAEQKQVTANRGE